MKTVIENLKDAGCDEASIAYIVKCLENGETPQAVSAMRRCRCEQLDRLHEDARRLDCLDYLIRKSEQERRKEKNAENRRTETHRRMG